MRIKTIAARVRADMLHSIFLCRSQTFEFLHPCAEWGRRRRIGAAFEGQLRSVAGDIAAPAAALVHACNSDRTAVDEQGPRVGCLPQQVADQHSQPVAGAVDAGTRGTERAAPQT
jgi:hypothetical protein